MKVLIRNRWSVAAVVRKVSEICLFCAGKPDSIRRSFISVCKDRTGAVAIVMAIALPVVIGAAGIGVETGKWYMIKRQAQTAADTAAYAGALELVAKTGEAHSAAVQLATKNGFTTGGKIDVTVNIPPKSGIKALKGNAVEVVVTVNEPLLFSALFLSEEMKIVARAVGVINDPGIACILSLNPSPGKEAAGVAISGSGKVLFQECSLASNSTKSNAIEFQGQGTVQVPSVSTAGGINQIGNAASVTITGSKDTYASALIDPYKDLEIKLPYVGCDHNKYKAKKSEKIEPGIYCDGIDTGSYNITLEPGTYYIDKGNFSTNGGSVKCDCKNATDGVTIVLTSSGAADKIGNVVLGGNVVINLRAPSVDKATAQYPYPGMLFIQDPNAKGGDGFGVTGNPDITLDGALYFPGRKVTWTGNSGSDACTLIVADTIEVTGNTTMSSKGCSKFNLSPIGSPPYLIE
jgi:hypothetical protein